MKKRERVTNQEDINAFVEGFFTGNEKIDLWLMERVAKSDIPNGDLQDKNDPFMYENTQRDGKRMFKFAQSDSLSSFLHTTVDFLKKAMDNDESIKKVIGASKLESIKNLKIENGFTSAAIGTYANKWQAHLSKQKDDKEADKEEKVVMEFEDGYKMIELDGKNAIKREGDKQTNCLGQKADCYGDGHSKFYSLRKDGEILASLYVYDDIVSETKAEKNETLKSCAAPLKEFIKKNNLKVHMNKISYDFSPEEMKIYGTTKDPIEHKYTPEQNERYQQRIFKHTQANQR